MIPLPAKRRRSTHVENAILCSALAMIAGLGCSSEPQSTPESGPLDSGSTSADSNHPSAEGGNADSGGASHNDSGALDDSSATAAVGAEWPAIKSSFGILTTLAGRGKSDNNNEWKPTFEGGPAIEAELSRPHMAMADDAGNVYIADKEAHGIRRVAPDGTIRTVAGTSVEGNAPDAPMPALEGALSSPNAVWVKPDGTFFILDLENAKVRRVTPAGQMNTLFALDSIPIGRGLWVSDDEMEAFVSAGTSLMHWSQANGASVYSDGFSSLGMVIKTAAGRVLVGDRGSHRVFEVSPDGAKVPLAGNGQMGNPVDGALATSTPFEEPRAIWPYGQGLLVGLHNACRLLYVDSAGATHVLLQGTSTSHAGDGLTFDPTAKTIGEMRSVTATRSGDVLFVEGDAGFVRVLKASRPPASP